MTYFPEVSVCHWLPVFNDLPLRVVFIHGFLFQRTEYLSRVWQWILCKSVGGFLVILQTVFRTSQPVFQLDLLETPEKVGTLKLRTRISLTWKNCDLASLHRSVRTTSCQVTRCRVWQTYDRLVNPCVQSQSSQKLGVGTMNVSTPWYSFKGLGSRGSKRGVTLPLLVVEEECPDNFPSQLLCRLADRVSFVNCVQ